MSANVGGSVGVPHEILLCWSSGPNSELLKRCVEIVECGACHAVVRGNFAVRKYTPVLLRRQRPLTEIQGIVRSCTVDGSDFLVVIDVRSDSQPCGRLVDPGALMVESFLTDRQIDEILAHERLTCLPGMGALR
jgi:hypothetical protein